MNSIEKIIAQRRSPESIALYNLWQLFAGHVRIRIDDAPCAWELVKEYAEPSAFDEIKSGVEQAGGMFVVLRGISERSKGLDSLDATVYCGNEQWDFHFSHNHAQLVRGRYDEKMWRAGRSELVMQADLRKRRYQFLSEMLYTILSSVGCDYSCAGYDFDEFCRELGYDPDSKTAEKTYFSVIDFTKRVRRLFSEEALLGMPR